MGGKVIDIIKEGDLNPSDDRPVAPPPQTAAPDVPEADPTPSVEPAPGGGILGPIAPQVVVYGPDGTAYPNPIAAEAAGVYDYTMSPPTINPIVPIDPKDPGELFFGDKIIGSKDFFPDFVTNSVVLPEPGYTTVGAGSDPANIQPIGQQQGIVQQPFVRPEMGLPGLLQSDIFRKETAREPSPFTNTGGSPLTPEQAREFARMAAMRGGIGSL